MRTPGLHIAAVLWRQRVVLCAALAVGVLCSTIVALRAHPAYVATATILMVAEPPESQNQKVPASATKPLLSADLPSLATSATVLTRLRADLASTEPFERFRSHIRAKVSVDSNVMPVTFSATTETGAVVGANALADEIARFYREIATKRFDSLSADLRGQLAARATELASYDARLQADAQAYPYIDIREGDGGAAPQSSVYERLIALRTERDETDATERADAANATIMAQRIVQARPLAVNNVVENDVVYKNQRDAYALDLSHLQHLGTYAFGQYPGLSELQRTVRLERANVALARHRASAAGPNADVNYVAALADATKATAQAASDRAKRDRLDDQIGALARQIDANGVASRVARLRRDRENAQTAYSVLAGTLARTVADRAQAASTGSVVVIDRASFAQRSLFTTGTFALVVLAVVTLWSAITLALLADRLRRRFYDDESVTSVYGTPVIGSL